MTQPFVIQVTAASPAMAVIAFAGGNSYTFTAASGVELDPYIDPEGQFVQRCIRCTDPGLSSFRAYYRPDAAGGREEWVFELGDPWAPTPTDLGAYTATITRADRSTQTVAVPGHYWFSRWRWQSSPRPVRRTGANLMAANLVPHFDGTGLTTGTITPALAYTPMTYAGIFPDETFTGGRQEIGLLTGYQAYWLARGGTEAHWRAQAEASGTMQWHIRDPRTGAPFNMTTYPNATMYSQTTGSPYIARTVVNQPDVGHFPSLAYVPFLLTGDPYYLEEMQFVADYMAVNRPSQFRISPQGRYWAWPTRGFGQTVVATPEAVPSWILPRSYFEGWLGKYQAVADGFRTNTTDPWCVVFRAMPEPGNGSPDPVGSGDRVWQHSFISLVAAWLVSAGRNEWRPFAEWAIQSEVDRASANSGYMRSHPSPYSLRMRNVSLLATAMSVTDTALTLRYRDTFVAGDTVTIDSESMQLLSSEDEITWLVSRTIPKSHAVGAAVFGRKFISWSELMASNILTAPDMWLAPPGDTLWLPATGIDLTYPGYHRAALAQAIHAGLAVPGLAESFAWLDAQLRANTPAHPIGENWSVVP